MCQYIEHVVALQASFGQHVCLVSFGGIFQERWEESDAKTEKRRTDNAVAGLEDRVQA